MTWLTYASARDNAPVCINPRHVISFQELSPQTVHINLTSGGHIVLATMAEIEEDLSSAT